MSIIEVRGATMAQELIDVLSERIEIYKLQKARVQLDSDIELKLKKTFPSLNQDVRLLHEMLDEINTMQNKKIDNNLIPEII